MLLLKVLGSCQIGTRGLEGWAAVQGDLHRSNRNLRNFLKGAGHSPAL